MCDLQCIYDAWILMGGAHVHSSFDRALELEIPSIFCSSTSLSLARLYHTPNHYTIVWIVPDLLNIGPTHWEMWITSVLATCVLVATAQQVSVKTPPFDLVGETLPVNYGNIPISPPGRVLPLSGKLVWLHIFLMSTTSQHFNSGPTCLFFASERKRTSNR